MKKSEIKRFHTAVREYQINTGRFSFVFMDHTYADQLKKEMKCTDPEFRKQLNIPNLAIVDGLDKDFVFIS